MKFSDSVLAKAEFLSVVPTSAQRRSDFVLAAYIVALPTSFPSHFLSEIATFILGVGRFGVVIEQPL
jgi:hypothetical protein